MEIASLIPVRVGGKQCIFGMQKWRTALIMSLSSADIMMLLNWILSGGIDNFKDKMEILCKGLVEKYPTAKIFFFTRWNCKNFKGSDSEKVVDAMIEVCGNYSIPIFDCARKGSIYADNDTFRKIYFQKSKNNTDTAHLNSKGHDRFLKVAESFLLQY